MAWALLRSRCTTSAGCGRWIQPDTAAVCTVTQGVFASEQHFRYNQNSKKTVLNTAYRLHRHWANKFHAGTSYTNPQAPKEFVNWRQKMSLSIQFRTIFTRPFPIALPIWSFSLPYRRLSKLLQKIYCPTSYIVNLTNLKEVKRGYPLIYTQNLPSLRLRGLENPGRGCHEQDPAKFSQELWVERKPMERGSALFKSSPGSKDSRLSLARQ